MFFAKMTKAESNERHCCYQILKSTNLVSCVTLSVTLEERQKKGGIFKGFCLSYRSNIDAL